MALKPTKEQQDFYDFILSCNDHARINAVAGSGKTTTIMESVKLISKDVKTLFCAFNNSIAREIASKFNEMSITHVNVKTLHSLGYDILRANAQKGLSFTIDNLKYSKICDAYFANPDNADIISKLLQNNGHDVHTQNKSEMFAMKNFLFIIKNTILDIVDKYRLTLAKEDIDVFRNMIAHFNIFDQKRMKQKTYPKEVEILFAITKDLIQLGNQQTMVIDFSDMIYLPTVLKMSSPMKYDVLYVDECQDLSKSQFAIAMKYVNSKGRVIAVGDPSQSIYGFTGADIESFNRFSQLPNIKDLPLSYCFRCPSNVIALAQEFRKDITAFKEREGNIKNIAANEIMEYLKENDLVICRTKQPLMDLMFALINDSRSVSVHQDDIKDFINDLRYIFNAAELNVARPDDMFFDSVLERGLKNIERKAKKVTDPDERDAQMKDEIVSLTAKIDFIKKQMIRHQDAFTISQLLKKIEKLIEGTGNCVKLSTIHKAKGLEAKCVFILEFDKLPMVKNGQKSWEIQQERNLKYVALTRAKNELFLVKSSEVKKMKDDSLYDLLDI